MSSLTVSSVSHAEIGAYHGEALRLLRGDKDSASRALIAAQRAFNGVYELAQKNAGDKQAFIYLPSFVDCVLSMTRLGLTPGSDEGYLLPYWSKAKKSYEVQLIVGPKGLTRLAYESGQVSRIISDVVTECDTFGYDIDAGTVKHVKGQRDYGNNGQFHAAIVSAYAQAIVVDQRGEKERHLVVLARGDIEYYRRFSKSPEGSLWGDHFAGAAKKTAIKRLCEQLPKRDGAFAAALRETPHGSFAKPADWESVSPTKLVQAKPVADAQREPDAVALALIEEARMAADEDQLADIEGRAVGLGPSRERDELKRVVAERRGSIGKQKAKPMREPGDDEDDL